MFKFNVAGKARKELVGALSEILGEESRYLGMQSMAYAVGGLVVDVNGEVEGALSAETLSALEAGGFRAEKQENESPKPAAPLFFASDAKEIQHYAKEILSDGRAHTAKEMKAEIARLAGRAFSVGAYAGAFRELVEGDCRYNTDGKGVYRFTPFGADAELLPFASVVAHSAAELRRLLSKTFFENPANWNVVKRAIETLDAVSWKVE
jgi:hypothetical protein